MRDALDLILPKLAKVIHNLSQFATNFKGFTYPRFHTLSGGAVRIFGVHISSFEAYIESRDMSREYALPRHATRLAIPLQTSNTDSEIMI